MTPPPQTTTFIRRSVSQTLRPPFPVWPTGRIVSGTIEYNRQYGTPVLGSGFAVNVPQLVEHLLKSREHMGNVAAFRHQPARPPQYAPLPDGLDPRLRAAYAKRGIDRLYSHQAESIRQTLAGRNVVVVTPTASGKTLCYNLPVLDAILKDPDARALYLFPTKALSQDQQPELHGLIETVAADIKTYTNDRATPARARRPTRQAGHV